jgi:hypothetical protein
MFSSSLEVLADIPGAGYRLSLSVDQKALSFADVIRCWTADERFIRFFTAQLADIPLAAYFWEMPALTRHGLGRPFECVFIDSAELMGVPADDRSFADYFTTASPVVDFANLGGDAWLVVPCPRGDIASYPHLATFSRQVPLPQQQALWQRVGQLLTERVDDQPLWLSTSGLGVYWLHLRMDRVAKYYSYRPYR